MLRRSLRTQITARVVALSAASAVLLAATLVLLIVAVAGQREAADAAFRSQEALTLANQLEKSLLSVESGVIRFITTGERPFLTAANRELARYPQTTSRLARLVSDDPGQQRRLAALVVAIEDYDELWVKSLLDVAGDDIGKGRDQVRSNGGRGYLDRIRNEFADLFQRERALLRERERSAEQRSAIATAVGFGGLALVLAIAVALTLYMRRAVLRPVRGVAEATGRLASGDLSTRVPTDREDELGALARGFNAMADSLERSRLQLEHSNAELSRSNAELEQFASVTSHDLQAPLTTISMYTELLERQRAGAGGEEDLVAGIRAATHHARVLIRDLLEYSRAGRGQLSVEDVPAADVVEQALEALAGAIEESGAEISVGELPVVRVDRANLSRVVQNLVGNAVKFRGEETPRVQIDAEREQGHWLFTVSDNGIGMDPAQATRIFEPFQRLHGEETYSGTGIGLAVCERIISQLGGRIWVTSSPGEGSDFRFTLPAVVPAVGEAATVGASA